MINNENKNKHGWIRIVEAFVAILLVTGIILVIISRDDGNQERIISEQVYNEEISILREVQINDSLRTEIISTSGTIGFNDGGFPSGTKNLIESKTPSTLECVAQICEPASSCFLSQEQEQQAQGKDIYAETVIIASNLDLYNPRQLKLFCWEK